MNKEYNKNTISDIPMDAAFNSSVEEVDEQKLKSKVKINAIGKKANNKIKPIQQKEFKSVRRNKSKYDSSLTDLEQLNEDNLQNYRYKARRNRVIIILLVVLLILAIGGVSVYMYISRLQTNCNMYAVGAHCNYIIDGKELDKFRAPAGLQGNRILRVKIQLEILERGSYDIKYIPKCYKNGELLDNVLILGCNFNLFHEGGDGYWYSNTSIKGRQKITLCAGVILDDSYEGDLNNDNFRLDFYTYLEKL